MIFDKATIEFVIIVISFIGGIFYLIAQIYKGRTDKKSSEEKDAEIALRLKDAANEALKAEISRINQIVVSQGKEIAALQAENRTYLKLIENRNPELETYMHDSMEYLKVIADGIKSILSEPTVSIHNEPPKHSSHL